MHEKSIEPLVRSELEHLCKDHEVLSGYDPETIHEVNQHAEVKAIVSFVRDLAEAFEKRRVRDIIRMVVSQLYRGALIREENALLRKKLATIDASVASLERQLSQAMIDELTGLPSRRIFHAHFLSELARIRRYGGELSLLFCDIDFFKRINDEFGHEAGDEVLRDIAKTIQDIFSRPTDHLCRFGGEEMVICLVNCNSSNMQRKAEELRKAIENRESKYGKITISIGGSHINGDRLDQLRGLTEWQYWYQRCTKDFQQAPNIVPDMVAARLLFAEADGLVYKAKENGRNRVEITQDPQELARLREIALQRKNGNGDNGIK